MIIYTSTPDYYNDVICHYGVKGMKWRNHRPGSRKVNTKSSTGSVRKRGSMSDYYDDKFYRKNLKMIHEWKMNTDNRYRIQNSASLANKTRRVDKYTKAKSIKTRGPATMLDKPKYGGWKRSNNTYDRLEDLYKVHMGLHKKPTTPKIKKK